MGEQPVSIITCDMEGRIETFNKGAEEIFGYRADEIIGKKRVSLFSPGMVVLGHVAGWLKSASENGEHRTRTTFVRKDGSQLAAEVRITPTFHDGIQIGYCGRSVELLDVDPAETLPPVALATRIIRVVAITRLPFLTATWLPVILATVWALQAGLLEFNALSFGLVFLGASLMHLTANTFNDYFDWTSGTDQLNNDYFLQLSGGSRAIELGLISERGLQQLATSFLLLSTACGIALMFTSSDFGLLWYGVAGACCALFYTAGPVRLAARRGLGELAIGLCFGPLMTAGTVYAMTGIHSTEALLLGLPLGLLTTNILWVNQFPDTPSDIAAGKLHLVATLGLKRASYGYLLLAVVAFGTVWWLVKSGIMAYNSLAALLVLPLALYTSWRIITQFDQRELAMSCWLTIGIQFMTGVLLIGGTYY